MNIAIVDDSGSDRRLLIDTLKEYFGTNCISADISEFSSAEALLKDYRPFMYTVIFMDIYMDGMTGTEAAAEIRKLDCDTLLVFLTTSDTHRADAFSAHAYDYIQKPVDKKRLVKLMDDIMKLRPESSEKSFTFMCGRTEHKIPFSDLLFVRSDGHYLEIADRAGNTQRTRQNFSSAEETLSQDSRFLLVLRGVIVNMDHILSFVDAEGKK